MRMKIMLFADNKQIAQVDLNRDNKVLEQDVKEILESKSIPVEKIKEVIFNIMTRKYER